MDIQRLRIFAAVARAGSLSRAGQSLHLSQPAISLQIKQLQAELNMVLFERESQGMRLTPHGAALLPWADKVVQALSEFKSHAASLHSEIRGQLRIGTILDPEFTRLGMFLKELVSSAPHLQPVLRQGISGEVQDLLANKELDVGFFLGEPNTQTEPPHGAQAWHCQLLSRFRYRVLAPSGWGNRVNGQSWRDLAKLPWIITPKQSAHHRMLAAVMHPLGLELPQAALVDQESSMVDLVRSGVGLSLAREAIAMREAQASGLVIADSVHLDCDLTFICLASRLQEAPIQAAVRAVQAAWD
ncbi:MAG: LysR family transcriptional regulator [Burkholderiaceae bacterium]|jgi:DNA-binding transcriptional LysR family regulator|nr:LysR family transcriptional regulator [Burkholderiaceae bacterium]